MSFLEGRKIMGAKHKEGLTFQVTRARTRTVYSLNNPIAVLLKGAPVIKTSEKPIQRSMQVGEVTIASPLALLPPSFLTTEAKQRLQQKAMKAADGNPFVKWRSVG